MRTQVSSFLWFLCSWFHFESSLADLPNEGHLIPLFYVNEEIKMCLVGASVTEIHSAIEQCFSAYVDLESNKFEGISFPNILNNDRLCKNPSPKTCLARHLHPIQENCFDNKHWHNTTTHVGLHMLETAFKLICDNDGARHKEFFSQKNEACVSKYQATSPAVRPFLECVGKLADEWGPKFDKANAANNKEEIERIRCRFFESAIECGKQHLQCESGNALDLAVQLANEVLLTARHCDRFPPNSAFRQTVVYSSLLVPIVWVTIFV